ncbi:FecR family protein [Flammeovirga sp. EKP202]|uniref:FecR family protein n=1 Tax=Flammeovirga sp. EKP202 TaxID=2770592 RepID=UPI00165EE12B|nr:FecR domain-containing protein [Flammeovirga sp. EKP202]MBD0400663.1 FecR domain-containing protein [Flammeovirga sp. EKP202]
MTENKETYSLIGKALAEELNEEERDLFIEKMLSDALFKEEFEQSKKLWNTPAKVSDEAIRSADHLMQSIEYTNKETKVIPFYQQWGKYIGAAVVVLATFIGGYNYISQQEEMLSQSTGFGESKEIILADGTKVLLNSKSSLEYPAEFKGDFRKVNLIGEAFFDVTKDKEHPFIVNASDLEVTVLGTSFNVSNYAKDKENSVALLTGKVKLKNALNSDVTTLSPGQTYVIDKEIQKGSVITENQLNRTSWLSGQVVFNYTSLKEVINKMERLYPISIEVKNQKLLERKITTKINKGDQLEEVLALLEILLECKIEKKNQLIILQ